MQSDDVSITYIDTSALEKEYWFKYKTSLRDELHRYKKFYIKKGNVWKN